MKEDKYNKFQPFYYIDPDEEARILKRIGLNRCGGDIFGFYYIYTCEEIYVKFRVKPSGVIHLSTACKNNLIGEYIDLPASIKKYHDDHIVCDSLDLVIQKILEIIELIKDLVVKTEMS